MKRLFLVIALIVGFVALQPSIRIGSPVSASTAPPCTFGGYDDHGTQINTGIICVTPAASGAPQATPAAGNCIGISTPPAAGTIAYNCPTPYPTPTAAPINSPAAGTCIGISTPPAQGTISYTCASPTAFPTVTSTPCNAAPAFSAGTLSVPAGCLSGGGTCTAATCGVVLNPTPLPSPIQSASPQPGWASTQYGYFAGLGPSPSPVINVPLYYYPTIGCGGTWGGIGTTTTQVNGVTPGLMGLFCNAAWKFAVDGAGNVGISNSLNTGGTIVLGGTGTSKAIYFPTDSGTNCQLIPESSFAHTIKITNDTSGGCNWDMSQSIGASKIVCTDSNGVTTACTGVAPSKGQVSCTLSALTCTATATVTSGSRCTASYDTTATTVTAALLLPLTVGVSGTTLSVGMQGAATATGTAAADYLCF